MSLHVRLREWQRLQPGDAGAEQLIGEHFSQNEERQLAARLAKSGILAVTDLHAGLEIRAFAHVGRLQLGNLTITVEPKLASNDLLHLVRYAYGLRNLELFEHTEYASSGQLLQDLLITQLHAEVREIVERGPAKHYVPRLEPLASPRGRIDMQRLAAAGGLTTSTLHCRHYLRSSDHLLNSVLLAGLGLAAEIAQDNALRLATRRLAALLAEFAKLVRLDTSVLNQAHRKLNRLVAAYQPAIRLIELLYNSKLLSLDDHDTVALPGFLFDMNRFFQSLLARFLKENLHEFQVHEEWGLSEMMRYRPGSNPKKRNSPTPRPDFMIAGGGQALTFLDAKYRDLWERSLPREMLYQLSIYALSNRAGSTAVILYPSVDRHAREAIVDIRDPGWGTLRGNVVLRPVVLSKLLAAIEEPQGRAAAALAHQLAFGSEGPHQTIVQSNAPI